MQLGRLISITAESWFVNHPTSVLSAGRHEIRIAIKSSSHRKNIGRPLFAALYFRPVLPLPGSVINGSHPYDIRRTRSSQEHSAQYIRAAVRTIPSNKESRDTSKLSSSRESGRLVENSIEAIKPLYVLI